MKEYAVISLETHIFFSRIMKEHALFLQAAFPAGEREYRNRANWYPRGIRERSGAGCTACGGNGWRRCAAFRRGIHGIYGGGGTADGQTDEDSHRCPNHAGRGKAAGRLRAVERCVNDAADTPAESEDSRAAERSDPVQEADPAGGDLLHALHRQLSPC